MEGNNPGSFWKLSLAKVNFQVKQLHERAPEMNRNITDECYIFLENDFDSLTRNKLRIISTAIFKF